MPLTFMLVVSWKVVKASTLKTKWLKSKHHWGIGVLVESNNKEGETRNSKIEHMIVYIRQQVVLPHSGEKSAEDIHNGPHSSLYG